MRLRGEPQLSVPAGRPGQGLARLLTGVARVDVVEDFTTEAWRKLCVNAVAGLMVLAGRRAEMFRRPDVAALARDLALECLAVARAEGARLADSTAGEIVAHSPRCLPTSARRSCSTGTPGGGWSGRRATGW